MFLILNERLCPARRTGGSWHLEEHLVRQEVEIFLAWALGQKVSIVF